MGVDTVSFKSPHYDDLDAGVTQRLGLPPGLLSAVRLRGERSNADQVSTAGAKTVYQIIPETRDAALKKWGVDAYLSPENAAHVAGLLLKDSLDRNRGVAPLAVAEYIGGTDPANWGKDTRAYVQRVTGERLITTGADPRQSTYARMVKRQIEANTPQIGRVYEAYKSGRMAPEDRAAFETDVAAGRVLLPKGAKLDGGKTPAAPAPDNGVPMAPAGVIEAYKAGKMDPADKRDFESDVAEGRVKVPEGVTVAAPAGVLRRVGDAVAAVGDQAAANMEHAATLVTGAVAPLAANVGAVAGQVLNGDLGDPRATALASEVASNTAAEHTYAPRTALAQDQQAAVAGALDASKLAGLNPAGAGELAAIAKPAAVQAVQGVRERLPGVAMRAEAQQAPAKPAPAAAAVNTGQSEVPPPVVQPQQTPEELARVTRKAAGGGIGSTAAKAELAAAAAPDAETVAAADRLGMLYQPDHVTTNDAYRTLAAVVKSIPTSEAKAAEIKILAHNAERADAIITELGGSRDMSAVSAGVKAELSRIEASFKAQAKSLYDEVARRVTPKTPAPADNVLAFIKRRADELGGAEHLSAGERKILADLTPKDGKPPTYALLDQTRKDIGEAARGVNDTFGTRDSRLLNQLQDALRKDQEAIATAKGAGDIWNAANASTRAYKGVQDDLVALFGKELSNSIVNNLASSTKALAKGDASGFIRLIKATPESMRHEVVASGLASAFNSNAAKGGINFGGYANWFEGLQRNTVARNALFSNLPKDAVQRLTDLYKVSKGISASTGQFIATGRLLAAPVKQILEADNLLSHVFNVAARAGAAEAISSTVGLPGAGIAAAVGSALTRGRTPAMKAADSLINSPEFLAAARNASKNNRTRLARSSEFAAYLRAIGGPRDAKAREAWIDNAIQPKKGPANE